ncbi:hypothetical protein E7681_18640, partial [Thalassobius vesicularis]
MIDFKEVKRRYDPEEPTRMLTNFCACLGQLELPFVMPPHFEGRQQEMNIHERHEVLLVQDLVHGKEVSLGMARPVEFARSPVYKVALEG